MTPGKKTFLLILGVAAALFLISQLALGLYIALGAPGYPDQPFAKRLEGWKQMVSTDQGRIGPEEAAALTPLSLSLVICATTLRLATLLLASAASPWRSMGKVASAGLAIFALALLLGLVRHRDLPAWAEEMRQIRPDASHLLITVFLAGALIAKLFTSW